MVQPKYLVLCINKKKHFETCQREDVAIYENYTGEAGLLFGRLMVRRSIDGHPERSKNKGVQRRARGGGAAGDNIVFLKPVPLSETRRSHAFRGENFVDVVVVEKYTQMMKRENRK